MGNGLIAEVSQVIREHPMHGVGGVHRGFPDPPDVSADLASRWRIIGTWASQHDTEQKKKPLRLRWHVDTLQA